MHKKITFFLVLLFVISRLFIWIFRPTEFSEIIYSYMPYAHLWASGTRPYLDQWYEYPPATIPLFYLPHVIDMSSHPYSWHVNYLQAYRGILLLVDIGIFILIWKTLQKQKVSLGVWAGGLLYYIVATAKANHFIYDTMDLTFAASLVLMVAAPILWPKIQHRTGHFWSWLGFWLATAFKYVNAPLAPLVGLVELKQTVPSLSVKKLPQLWWPAFKVGLVSAIAFIAVWGLPLVLYRSSLQVSLIYHEIRGVQVDSVPAIVVRTINSFTKTDHFIEVYKNYETSGPVTDQVKHVFDKVFIAALGAYGLWAIRKIWITPKDRLNQLLIHLTLTYVFVFLLTGKVLSPPFLLWHIPLLALYPFASLKTQLKFTLPSLLMMIVSMTQVSNDAIWVFPLPLIMGWIRTLCLLYFVYYFMRNSKLYLTK